MEDAFHYEYSGVEVFDSKRLIEVPNEIIEVLIVLSLQNVPAKKMRCALEIV